MALPGHSLAEYWAETRPVAAGELEVPHRDLRSAECVCSLPALQAFSPAEVSEMVGVFSLRPWVLEVGFFQHAVGAAVVPA